MKYSQSELPSILRTEGINCLGSGPAAKLVALDTKLSIEAKAIYALLCSYSGSGNTEFPCVANILKMLGLSANTYYKHLNTLTSRGYVKVEQQTDGSRFQRNIYTLIMDPPCLKELTEGRGEGDTISASGILSGGFGIVSKAVMIDSRISCKAKGLYFFYCTFTGAGGTTMPARDKIEYFLGISKNSLSKYKKELTDLNFIEDRPKTVKGKFAGTDIVIMMTPKGYPVGGKEFKQTVSVVKKTTEKEDKPVTEAQNTENSFQPCPKICDTENTEFSTASRPSFQPCPKICDTEIASNPKICDTEPKPCPKNPCPKICDTRNTYIRKEVNIYPDSFSHDCIFTEGEERYKVLEKVKSLTNWYLSEEDISHKENVELFNEALTDMVCSKDGTKVMNVFLTARDVVYKLNSSLEQGAEDETLILYDLLINSLIDFEHGCKLSPVRNRLRYMQSCIWTCMKLNSSRLIDSLVADL